MARALPLRANLDWLKKTAKERLAELRASHPQATLAEAQLALARDYGFASWRKLKARVEQVNSSLAELVPSREQLAAAAATVAADDPDLALLFAAVEAGNADEVARLLRRRPELVQAYDPEGQTALHVAAWHNDDRLAVVLMACGADPEAKYGRSGHTALSWAVTCNSSEFAATLVRLGVKPDLFCAAGVGSIDHVRACFDAAGQLLPGSARTGSSRLDQAGNRLPCPPETMMEQVSDALYIASRNAQVEVVRFLLSQKPDLSFRAYEGGTALHWAYFGGSREVVELLLQAGADAAARDSTLHCTPRDFGICIPASWGFASLVQKQLQRDPALANAADGPTTPLHEAARGGHQATVQLLLAAGADPNRRNAAGQTAAELATDRGYPAIAALLLAAIESGHGSPRSRSDD